VGERTGAPMADARGDRAAVMFVQVHVACIYGSGAPRLTPTRCQLFEAAHVDPGMKNFAAILAVVAMFAFPGVAFGQGGSGADAYEENIPGGGGNTPSNDNGGQSGTDGGSSLPEGTQGALEEQGADGAAAANLAEQTGPGGNGSRGDNSTGSGAGNGAGSGSSPDGEVNLTPADDKPAGSSSGSGIDEVVGELAGGSDDGMGILLPIILGSVLVAGVAFVLIRRSSGGSAGSA